MKNIWKEFIIMMFSGILLLGVIISLEENINFFKVPSQNTESAQVDYNLVPELQMKFGIITDSLLQVSGIIRRNEFLADIFRRQGIDYQWVQKTVAASRGIFDVRKMKRGNPYHFFYEQDSFGKHLYAFVYELDGIHFVIYRYDSNSVTAKLGKKKVFKTRKVLTGTIDQSLWMSVTEQGANPTIALSLSEIFAWTIDFFDLKKGDQYVVIYDDLFTNQKELGPGKIHSALIIHQKQPYYAFHYTYDSIDDYFDEKGASLRRTFLKAPLRFSRISSGYSNNRFHPVLKIYRPHHGIDYAAPTGTPVHALGDGVIIKKAYQPAGGGRYLKIKHNSTYTTTYMHLSGYARGMHCGRKVKQGEVIGFVGSSGLATGPHLDFRVYKHGTPVNPLSIKSPPIHPVDSTHLETYLSLVKNTRLKLDSLLNREVTKRAR
jgi:murein DD-endopeptidase MepM/ murein hydrolase activator NlpD